MAYQWTHSFDAGPANAGATLWARLVNAADVVVANNITTGFRHIADGRFKWTYASHPDGFEGTAEFLNGTTVVAVIPINPAETEPARAILDAAAGVETGLTLRQFFRGAAALFFGKVRDAETTAPKFRDVNDTVDRVIGGGADQHGNRETVTLDLD